MYMYIHVDVHVNAISTQSCEIQFNLYIYMHVHSEFTALFHTLTSNLEGLCRTAYLHLQRVAKERDGHFDVSEIFLVYTRYYA